MTIESDIDGRVYRRRSGRAILLAGIAIATACAGLVAVSWSSHRAGAATARPHALNGPVSLSLSASGIVGEGGVGGPGTIDVRSFSWGVTTSVGSSSSGAGAGKAKFAEFQITKQFDSASPLFFKNCVAGAHFKAVTLVVRKADSAVSEFMTFKLSTVFISGVSWSADVPSGATPTESITLVAKAYNVTFTRAPAG